MSMNLNVYVGPYLEIAGVDNEFIEKHEAIVMCGEGEARNARSKTRHLISNRIDNAVPGIDRQMSFSKHDICQPLEIIGIDIEKELFQKAIQVVLNDAHPFAESCRILWGVVCGEF